LPFLRFGPYPLQHFHVAGIRRAAIQGFRRQLKLTQFRGDIRVVEVGQPVAHFRIRQEEIPQSGFFRFRFRPIEQFELTRMPRPPVFFVLIERKKLLGDRFHVFLYVPLYRIHERLRFDRHRQIE